MKYLISSILLVMSSQAFAKESEQFKHGSKVHQNHCLKCHTDSLYTRDNRIVKSINALGKQVRICRDNTDAPWFDSDTDAVIDFLNQKYYQF